MNDKVSPWFRRFRLGIPAVAIAASALISFSGTSFSAQAAAASTSQNAVKWPDLTASLARTSTRTSSKDSALIVGIEDYAFVDDIQGARKNAEDWWLYFRKKNGIARDSARILRDKEGTREKILREAQEAAGKVKAGGTLWFIFIGHGVASKSGEEGMLVGADAQGEAESLDVRSIRQSELENIFRSSKASKIMMIVDSCFSGRTSDGSALAPGLQALVRKSQATAEPRIIRMSAGKSDQFAGALPRGDRPAFSYLILGALTGWGDADSNGVVTAKEAVDYAADVLDTLVRTRRQTPELIASANDRNFPLSAGAKDRGPDIDLMLLNLPEGGDSARAVPAASGEKSAAALQKDISLPAPKTASAFSQEALAAQQEKAPADRTQADNYRGRQTGVQPQQQSSYAGESSGERKDRFPAPAHVPASRSSSWQPAQIPDMEFIRVPAGSFHMVNEGQHHVFSRDFEISKTPVTVSAFRLCIAVGACTPEHFQKYDEYDGVNLRNFCNLDRGFTWEQHPMNCVDQRGADQFCRWVGGRLPTEAEWRYAAGNDGYRFVQSDFPWGKDRKGAACQKSNSLTVMMFGRMSYCFGKTAVRAVRVGGRHGNWMPPPNAGTSTVGLYSPQRDSALGLTDLIGNVNEWTESPSGIRYSCDGGENVPCHHVKGGGWRWQMQTLDDKVGKGTVYTLFPENAIEPDIGFRCVRNITPP